MASKTRLFLVGLAIAMATAGCGTQTLSAAQPAQQTGFKARSECGSVPQGYYDATNGLTGKPLLSALHRIVAKHRDLGYNGARDILFAKIGDPDNDDAVADLYTGEVRKGVKDRGTATRAKMNTEHTWPQSLGAVGAAKSDLHHLQPSDIKINSDRGSMPYGEVTGTPLLEFPGIYGTSRIGMDGMGHKVFEPRPSVRGDIARGLLYFYTAYSVDRSGGPSLVNFKLEAATLIKWSAEDPAEPADRQRNDAVYEVQGNRNPFVDRPEFLTQIGPLS